MKPKLIIVLVLIVITPLAIAGWLGARIVRDEQVVLEHGLRELMRGQLRGVDATVTAAMERYQRAVLEEMNPLAADAGELRMRGRQSAYVVQYYVLDGEGQLLFPPAGTPAELTVAEREALDRTSQIWDGGVLVGPGSAAESTDPTSAQETSPLSGWHVGYWGSGLQWMLWARDGGLIHAAEINRTRLLAELVAALPETDALAPELTEGRIRLIDSAGRALYQWGSFEAEEDAEPIAALNLSAPLGAWSLEYHAPAAVFGSTVTGGLLLNLVAGLAVLAGAVIGLTYYFYREQSREMREAVQRVSFVNQVSHELKTPLTNIRMYAELLQKDADRGDDPRRRRHVDIIASESQRLSRLIGNVLTFGRKQRHALELRRKAGVVDDVLRSVLDHFRPALEAKEIEVKFAPDAGESASFDADAVEQIVGNLISNVEKYGAGGKFMELTSLQRGDTIEITVADRGPGLPPRERQRIFEPFYRVSSDLTDGVSGTGIGLAISRDLARLHGGDLVLEPSREGARFRLTLAVPPEHERRFKP